VVAELTELTVHVGDAEMHRPHPGAAKRLREAAAALLDVAKRCEAMETNVGQGETTTAAEARYSHYYVDREETQAVLRTLMHQDGLLGKIKSVHVDRQQGVELCIEFSPPAGLGTLVTFGQLGTNVRLVIGREHIALVAARDGKAGQPPPSPGAGEATLACVQSDYGRGRHDERAALYSELLRLRAGRGTADFDNGTRYGIDLALGVCRRREHDAEMAAEGKSGQPGAQKPKPDLGPVASKAGAWEVEAYIRRHALATVTAHGRRVHLLPGKPEPPPSANALVVGKGPAAAYVMVRQPGCLVRCWGYPTLQDALETWHSFIHDSLQNVTTRVEGNPGPA
jgi:hypothetical protein